MKRRPPPDWQAIASFYAGRPVTLGVDKRGPMQATTGIPESGQILLGGGISSALQDFAKQWLRAKTDRQRASLAALGANPLSVLLHESMHNKHFTDGYFDPENPNTGFRNAGNENQAIALGAELMPDMLRRFFGIGLDSPVSKAFANAAKRRADYQSVYHNPYVPPPSRPL